MPLLSLLAASALMVMLVRPACKVWYWWRLHRSGPADWSAQLLEASSDKVVTKQCLHWGKITFVGRHDVAAQVFKPKSFVNSLGSKHGLKLLGMYKQGIIWNNDTTGWQTKREYFAKGIQALVLKDATHAKLTTLAAFKLTLAEHCCAAAAAATPSHPTTGHTALQLPPAQELAALPLSELAAQVSGISLDLLPDGRDFLRLVTFRVTAALAFVLPVDALGRHEALDVVHKVAAFFKAWDYFLLRPAWLCRTTSWTAQHHQHLAAVQALQDATAHLIKLASSERTTITAAAASAGPANPCFLSKLLADQAAGVLSQQAVQQLALEMLLAGTDTSSISLYYLLVQLSDDPQLEQQLLAEVLQAAGGIHNLSDAQLAAQLPISAKDDAQLPQCQASLCEVLRFKPVGPVSIRQATEPVTLVYHTAAGRKMKEPLQPGDTVIVSLATMHRDPAVFSDPDSFNPAANFAASYQQPALQPAAAQRHSADADTCPFRAFAAADTSNKSTAAVAAQPETQHAVSASVTDGASHAFRPFGHGRKGCVGRELGWLEMKVMLACWLLTMRFRRDPSTPQLQADSAAAGVGQQVWSWLASGSVSRSRSSSRSSSSAAGTAQPGLLDRMQTRWEVAAQPIQPLPLHVRCVQLAGGSRRSSGLRRLYVVGPHGSGKTTLCNALMQVLAPAAAGSGAAAAAPAGADDDITHGEQAAAASAVAAPAGSEAANICTAVTAEAGAKVLLITETARHVMATHGINREQFMQCSNSSSDASSAAGRDATFLRLQQLITAEQLERERAASVAAGCVVLDRAIVDVLAYATERWGSRSPEMQQLLRLPATQELLSNCRAATSLVLLLPPYDAGLSGPVDDGVRMTTPAGLTAAFKVAMQQQGVAYEVVSSSSVRERLAEVLGLLGAGPVSRSRPDGASQRGSA